MRKLSLIGLILTLNLYPTRSEAQLVINPQPYINASGISVGSIQINIPANTAGNNCGFPAYSFITSTNTGMFLRGISELGFCTGGTNSFAVLSQFVAVKSGSAYVFSTSSSDADAAPDIYIRRGAAKTLTFDTDGAGGSLTLLDIKGSLTSSSNITGTNILSSATGQFLIGNRGTWDAPGDGIFRLLNNAGTGFTRLVLGMNDATTSGASLVLSSGSILFKTGDGSSADIDIRANSLGLGVSPPGSGKLALSGTVSTYHGIATAGEGIPYTVGTTGLLSAQTANIGTTNLVASVAAGVYEVCGTVAVRSVGTTSTMPNITIGWNNGTAQTVVLTSTNTSNSLTTHSESCTLVRSAASQAITYATNGYASTGTPMQYETYVTARAVY